MTENEFIQIPASQQVTEEMKKQATFMLNGVPFCPYDHFVKIKGQDGRERDYLPYAARLAWFRAVYPQGTIKTEIKDQGNIKTEIKGQEIEDVYVLIKAYVDNGQGVTSEAYGSCTRASFPRGYVEKAETKAKNRALADLGLGTLAAQELEDDLDDVSDTPQVPRNPRPAPAKASTAPQSAPAPVKPSSDEKQEARKKQARLAEEIEVLKIPYQDGSGVVTFAVMVAKGLNLKKVAQAEAAIKRGLTLDECIAVEQALEPYRKATSAA